MSAADILALLKEGGWGVATLCILVIVYLERGRNAATSRDQANLQLLLEALHGFRETLTELTAAVSALREMLVERRYTIADVSRQLDTIDGKVRHGFGNVSAGMNGIANLLAALSGRRSHAPPLIPPPFDGEDAA